MTYTTHTVKAERRVGWKWKNRPSSSASAKGASTWPEDQKRRIFVVCWLCVCVAFERVLLTLELLLERVKENQARRSMLEDESGNSQLC